MSKQPEDLTGFAGLIVHAVALCQVTGKPRILYNHYIQERMKEGRGVGKHGTGPDAVKSWTEGRSIPDAEEFFFLKRAINRRLEEIGEPTFFEEEPFPRTAPWGDGGGADNDDAKDIRRKLSSGVGTSLASAKPKAA